MDYDGRKTKEVVLSDFIDYCKSHLPNECMEQAFLGGIILGTLERLKKQFLKEL